MDEVDLDAEVAYDVAVITMSGSCLTQCYSSGRCYLEHAVLSFRKTKVCMSALDPQCLLAYRFCVHW